MGLFDTFYPSKPFHCPKCQAEIKSFQSKALDPCMMEYQEGSVIYNETLYIHEGNAACHTSCDNCHTWIEADIFIKDGKFERIDNVVALEEEDEDAQSNEV